MDAGEAFQKQVEDEIAGMAKDTSLASLSDDWMNKSIEFKYSYHFSWMGVPIIQYPQDMIAMQELIWQIKPDLIIEAGIARGGSLIFYASMLELIGNGHVLGIDVDIRPHNKEVIEKHPMSKRITMVEGSSIAPEIVSQVATEAKKYQNILVCLDSNHTYDHVLAELKSYGPMVTKGSYLVVFDTVIEKIPASMMTDRFWGKGNNPQTAIEEYLQETDRFIVNKKIDGKLQISVAPGGYLQCVKGCNSSSE